MNSIQKKNIFIAAAPGSASRTLIQNIEKFTKKNFISLTSGEGFGHTIVNISSKDKIYLFLRKIFFPNKQLLFYQHLFPSKYNFYEINRYIGDCHFIVTYRNIFEQINYFYKILNEANRTPLSIINYKKNLNKDTEIDLILILLLNFYKLWFELIQNNILKNYSLMSYSQIITRETKTLDLLESLFQTPIKLDEKFNLKEQKIYQIKDKHKIMVTDFIKEHHEIDFSLILN